MIRQRLSVLITIVALTGLAAADPVSEVRLEMGTANTPQFSHGNLYPAISMPWGMSAWSPQTAPGWDPSWWLGGFFYDWTHSKLYGLRHTHQPSPWIGDFGAWSVLPMTGKFESDREKRFSWFSHAMETMAPDYYRVYLADYDLTAELAPSVRSAAIRVTYPESDAPGFVIDSLGGEVRIEGDRTVRGVNRLHRGERSGVAANFANRFVLVFDRPFIATETTTNGALYVRFAPVAKGAVLNVKASSSFISDEQADVNLLEVAGGFDAVRKAARNEWNEKLGRIAIEGGTAAQRETFYTCLYRSLLFPRIFHEVGTDGVIRHYSPTLGEVKEGRWYYGTGFWDTFRALFPLITFVYPEEVGRMLEGYESWIKETGWFPEWSNPGLANCMIGNNSHSAITDAILAGVPGAYDPKTLYKGMLRCSNAAHPTVPAAGRWGVEEYNKRGYIPYDFGGKRKHATSRTLEYAYDDWCVARLGEKLGRPASEIALYDRRAGNWTNVFDRTRGLAVGRCADGTFRKDFNPLRWDGDFVEGNSYHYSFSALHDIPGVIAAMGGKDAFVKRLDGILAAPPDADMSEFGGDVIHEAREMQTMGFGQYAHGNQPSQHVLYLYGYAGALAKTQYWVREAMNRLYRPTPDGYCGDEDNGQTSAWYVWSALGFYPVCPAAGEYALGAPFFERATVSLPQGRKLVIDAKGVSDKVRTTTSIAFGGEQLVGNTISRKELLNGGNLVFTMDDSAAEVYDLVVYGGTPAGIAAAVEAKRHGLSAILLEPSKRIGGLTTGGLGQTDTGGNRMVFGGISGEFYREIWKFYHEKPAWNREHIKDYKSHGSHSCGPTPGMMWAFEPHVAEAILDGWMRKYEIPVVREEPMTLGPDGVELSEGRLTALKTVSGRIYRGRMFVDASYEGDLMAAAGVSYLVGREPNAEFDETINGMQMKRSVSHQFAPGVDPYVVKGDKTSGLLPGVEPYRADEHDGDGDSRLQAYNYRLCLTDDPANRIPFTKPDNYDPLEYELMLRNYEQTDNPELPVNFSPMPNRKTDSNNSGAFSSDFIGRNYAYPEASWEERGRIAAEHLDYVKGLMWTAMTNPRVPEKIRSEVARWGTCKDEFVENGGWSDALYVREARRMRGEYVMTEHNNRGVVIAPRPIACGVYQIDSHNARRRVGADGFVHNEGDVQDCNRTLPADWATAYSIDYGSIIPKRDACENLFVPVCLSATHTAFGSIRMEPVFFALGHAAGAAAAIAVRDGLAAQDVPYAKLAEVLKSEGQVLADERLTMFLARQGAGEFSPDGQVEIRFCAKPVPSVSIHHHRAETVPSLTVDGLGDIGDFVSAQETKLMVDGRKDANRELLIRYSSGAVVKLYISNSKASYVIADAKGTEFRREFEIAPIAGAPAGKAAEYFREAVSGRGVKINDYAIEDPFGPDFHLDFPGAPVCEAMPRFYRLAGLRNVRDIGGWTGLKPGRVFRGSQLYAVKGFQDGIDPETARSLKEELKIATDLDLRGAKEWAVREYSEKGLAELEWMGIPKQGFKFPSYGGLLKPHLKDVVAGALRVFTEKKNYPIYVHCAGGADRTGSLVLVLEALCGVSEEKIDIDYELTSFATIYGQRTREGTVFQPWRKFKDEIRSAYPAADFGSSVRRWVQEGLGLSEAEIAAIRDNLMK